MENNQKDYLKGRYFYHKKTGKKLNIHPVFSILQLISCLRLF